MQGASHIPMAELISTISIDNDGRLRISCVSATANKLANHGLGDKKVLYL